MQGKQIHQEKKFHIADAPEEAPKQNDKMKAPIKLNAQPNVGGGNGGSDGRATHGMHQEHATRDSSSPVDRTPSKKSSLVYIYAVYISNPLSTVSVTVYHNCIFLFFFFPQLQALFRTRHHETGMAPSKKQMKNSSNDGMQDHGHTSSGLVVLAGKSLGKWNTGVCVCIMYLLYVL